MSWARVEAMISHYKRSNNEEFIFLCEEEGGFHPDEGEYWYERPSLWWRGHKALWNSSAKEYNYYIKNTDHV